MGAHGQSKDMVFLGTTRHSVDFRCTREFFRASEPVREGGSKKLVLSGQETLEIILQEECQEFQGSPGQ